MNNIPKGYKLVPVEPTEEILTALIDTWFAASPIDDQEAMAQAYKAMLAAAPTPPQTIFDEASERELFEAWYLTEYYECDKQCGLEWLSTEPCGNYRFAMPGQHWRTWKACAQSRAKAGEVGHE